MMNVNYITRRETYVMRFNPLTAVWTVAVHGTPEMSAEGSQLHRRERKEGQTTHRCVDHSSVRQNRASKRASHATKGLSL